MNFVHFYFVVPNIEEEAGRMADKDGWIKLNEFKRFAIPTELCKIEFQDRVFQKVDYGEEERKAKEEAKAKQSKAKVRNQEKLLRHIK